MQKILENLYHGNIQPYAKQFLQNTEYTKAVAVVQENQKKLGEVLSDDVFAYVETLLDAQGNIDTILSRENFIEGFKLGVQLVVAGLSDDKSEIFRDITDEITKAE